MRKDRRRSRAWFAFALAFLMIGGVLFQLIPPLGVDAASLPEVADASTAESYKDALGDGSSTRYSGRVWTDKSVYTGDAQFSGQIDGEEMNFLIRNDSDFLVAYSALATSTMVTSQVPVDVVFVIDLSSSMLVKMGDENGVAISRLAVLIDGLNQAISTIMSQNENNRVAVVGYRSSPTKDILLPLGSYIQAATENAFTLDRRGPVISSDPDPDVKISCNVASSAVTISTKQYGGTNIQTGVYDGMELLTQVADTTVNIGGTQVTRAPYVVLMSDGLATHSSSAEGYWNPRENPDEVNYGLGGDLVFSGHSIKAMMTAAYMKQAVDINYGLNGTDAPYQTRVLTFGMGLKKLDDTQEKYAIATLDPANATGEVAEEIRQLFEAYSAMGTPVVNTGVRFRFHRVRESGVDWRSEDWVVKDNSDRVPVLGGGDPGVLFEGSKYAYYETGGTDKNGNRLWGFDGVKERLVTFDGKANETTGLWSGYAYFDDYAYKLTHPQSNDISSLHYNDAYYAAETAEDVGMAFRDIVADITNSRPSVPTQVEGDPVRSGYITYEDVIGGYMEVKAVKEILWSGHVFTDPEKTTEGNVTTYTFRGTIDSPVYGQQQLSYIIITVTQNPDNTQTLQVKIPASAIPIRVNTISLGEGNTVLSNTHNNAYPIRVFYTVGLADNLLVNGKLDPTKLSQSYLEANTNDDGTVNFYSNRYSGNHQDLTGQNPQTVGDATVTFQPADDNPYYFNGENVPLFRDQACTQRATAEDLTTAQNLYRKIQYYEGTAMITEVVARSTTAYRDGIGIDGDGKLYVKAKSYRISNLARFINEKEPGENPTETAETSYYPVYSPETKMFTVYQGNNGRMSVPVARGSLSVSKTVAGTGGETNRQFTFEIRLANGASGLEGTYDAQLYTNGQAATVTVVFRDGAARLLQGQTEKDITLKDGQTLVITGLPAGYSFTVAERDPNENSGAHRYETQVSGAYAPADDTHTITTDSQSRTASGSVVSEKTAEVDYTNTCNLPITGLTVTKTVTGAMGDANRPFNFRLAVTLDGAAYTQPLEATRNPGNTQETLSADQEGNYTFTLKHGESLFVQLPYGCRVTVTETAAPGYSTASRQYEIGPGPEYSENTLTQTVDRLIAQTTVDYRNRCELDTPPTGIAPWEQGFGAMVLLAAGAAVLLTVDRVVRRRRDGV